MNWKEYGRNRSWHGRLCLKCDGTRAETRFRLSAKGRVHLYRCGRKFSRLLVAEVCASAVVMLDKSCSEVVWRVLATHSIRQFPLHFPFPASACAIIFQPDSTALSRYLLEWSKENHGNVIKDNQCPDRHPNLGLPIRSSDQKRYRMNRQHWGSMSD